MVPYNIAPLGPGHYHRGSSGTLAVQEHPATRQALPAFRNAGLALELVADMKPLLWGKLLLNLNNPVNALSGLPLRAELMDAGYRRGLAALQKEALAVLNRAGIAPAKVGAVPPRKAPLLLRLPTPVFRLLAARMLRIDEHARSSMADDLAHKRPTEIDALCGEVVRLAHSVGMDAPLNEKMVELVNWPRTAPMSSRQLRAALGVCGSGCASNRSKPQ
jgi:2-dehydropantoate 2-reductase